MLREGQFLCCVNEKLENQVRRVCFVHIVKGRLCQNEDNGFNLTGSKNKESL